MLKVARGQPLSKYNPCTCALDACLHFLTDIVLGTPEVTFEGCICQTISQCVTCALMCSGVLTSLFCSLYPSDSSFLRLSYNFTYSIKLWIGLIRFLFYFQNDYVLREIKSSLLFPFTQRFYYRLLPASAFRTLFTFILTNFYFAGSDSMHVFWGFKLPFARKIDTANFLVALSLLRLFSPNHFLEMENSTISPGKTTHYFDSFFIMLPAGYILFIGAFQLI